MAFPRLANRGPIEGMLAAWDDSSSCAFPRLANRGPLKAFTAVGAMTGTYVSAAREPRPH